MKSFQTESECVKNHCPLCLGLLQDHNLKECVKQVLKIITYVGYRYTMFGFSHTGKFVFEPPEIYANIQDSQIIRHAKFGSTKIKLLRSSNSAIEWVDLETGK